MIKKKIIYRQCVVTKDIVNRENLIRIVKTKENQVFVDLNFKIDGRGIYVKKNSKIISKMKQQKLLEKKFNCIIKNDIYQILDNIVSDSNHN